MDDLTLKGFNHPVLAVEILAWHENGVASAGVTDIAEAAATRRRKQPS
jgi:hypothetical protein